MNKKVFVLGMARSGYEVAKLLSVYNNEIIINDMDVTQEPEHVSELQKLGVNIILGEHPDDALDESFDYLIKNPGIKDSHKYVEFCKEKGIEVLNEIEVAYHFLPKDISIIGITGTNGKTTTATLIYKLLSTMYPNTYLAGNIGFPLSSFVGKISPGDYLVLEVSVQQLMNTKNFKTNVSVLTNLAEAHLDHTNGYDNYLTFKGKIFDSHSENDIAVINKNNDKSLEVTENIKSSKQYFSIDKNCECFIENGIIFYKGEEIIKLCDIKVVGNHNYENIMCAISVAKIYGVSNEVILDVLSNFIGVEHRLEFVTEYKNRKFYNDSKSTNNESAITALKVFGDPIVIIMGGLDRGQNFEELGSYVNNVKLIVAYGETKDRIGKFAELYSKKCIVHDNLEESIITAYKNSSENDIILLSPACASLDQYKNIEERGTEFKRVVTEISEG